MKRLRYEVGVIVQIDGVRHRFVARTQQGHWQLVDLSTNSIVQRKREELNMLYMDGNLILDPEQDRLRSENSAYKEILPASIGDLPEKAQARIHLRRTILDEVGSRIVYGTANSRIVDQGNDTTILRKTLDDVCREIGCRPVSVMTYYRWKKVIKDTGSNIELQGEYSNKRTARVHPVVRRIVLKEMADVLAELSDKTLVGKGAEVPIRAVISRTKALIRNENLKDPTANLKPPARSTYYAWWSHFSAFDRAVAKHGKTRARAMFRASPGHRPIEKSLDKAEYDETKLPLFFVDEDLMIPLGRPWLNWYVDVFSQMPLGIYLGFEPPSDLTISSALRHACLPKTYVRNEYPDIKNEYLAMGIPNFITFDNSLSQWGRSIRDITRTLNCHYDFTPARMPWFKSTVEGMFQRLNQLLLKELPGFVLGNVDGFDYNPAVSGCIGIRHFLTIFHHWLIDIYCQKPTGFSRRTPAQRWVDGTVGWEPDLIPRASDLDVVFGIVKDNATLDHRGVVYEDIRYFSDDLQAFRYQFGDNRRVRVKLNPSDMGKLYVWLPVEKAWIRANVVEQMRKWAVGRSLYAVQVINRYRKKMERADEEAWDEAVWRLQDMIRSALPDALGIKSNSRIARFGGIGTQNIFGNQGVDGQLGSLTGPFAGLRLNPLNDLQAGPPGTSQSDQREIRPSGKKISVQKLRVDRSLRRHGDE